MSLSAENHPTELADRLRDAYAVTAEFLSDFIDHTCRRFPSRGKQRKDRAASSD